MNIVVDIREGALINELKQYASDTLKITTAALDIGDIHFIDDISGSQPILVLERKTVPDLASSQKDGRYREQRARLLALRGAGTKIGYIVEEGASAFSPSIGRTWCQGKFTEVNLQTAITRLQLRYDIPVFHAVTLKDTVQWIRRFAACIQEEPTVFKTGLATTVSEAKNVYTEAIRVKKSSNQTPELSFTSMLQTLPGVGLQAAAAIGLAVDHKISNLLVKTEDELAAINTGKKKLGKTAAALIFKTFHE
jgi:ERCC4-type nuclease